MGRVSWYRSGLAIVLLFSAFVLATFFDAKAKKLEYPVSLSDSFLVMAPWRNAGNIPIEDNVISSLDLDDYLYRHFVSDTDNVSLYVGFYHSADKVGAAHDPLVCFQGQGWVISKRNQGALSLPDHQVKYSSMVASNGDSKEYVFYWFQSFDNTENSTHEQKLKILFNKLSGKWTSNAFVRITTTISDGSVEHAHERAERFVKDFYPLFYNYVIQGKS